MPWRLFLLNYLVDSADIIIITFSVDEDCIQPFHLIATIGMVAVKMCTPDVWRFWCAVSLWAVLTADSILSLPMLADSDAYPISYICYS